MSDQLQESLRRLVGHLGAEGALVWCRRDLTDGGIVLAGYPVDIPSDPSPCAIPGGVADGSTVCDPARLAAMVPAALLDGLPEAPTAARSLALGDDLFLTVVWCDPHVDDADEDRQSAVEEVSALAHLVRELRRAEAEIGRLRATMDLLEDAVVTVDARTGKAYANTAAARLLSMSPGRNPVPVFESGVSALAGRALNRDDVDSWRLLLESDPTASIECTWLFTEEPTHVVVMSRPVRNHGLEGRIWVFYDDSVSARAIEDTARARDLLQASADGMIDPQILLVAVRGPSGRIVDFVFRDVNRATCAYLTMSRSDLIGRTLLETMPNMGPSGLLEKFARCAESHQPVVLDDFRYQNEILDGPRNYDIRANYAGRERITITWRDVSERSAETRRLAESEARFRLLAENASDVVVHVRDSRITWMSPSVRDALGAPAEHWIGREIWEIIPEEDHDAHDKVTWLSQDRAIIPRGRVRAADGTVHWAHVHVKTFYDTDGHPDGYTSAFRIIDEEVQAVEQAELADRRQAEADLRYRKMMDNAAVGMGVLLPNGLFEEVNQAACDFFGYDAATLKQKTWQELTPPEYLETDLRDLADMAAGRVDSYRVTKQFIHADGHLVWAAVAVSCLRKPNGDLDRIIGQVTDITMEVEAREFLARRDEQNRILATHLQAQTDRLLAELRSASAYVASILPDDLDGAITVSSRYLPSRELGGDCFDYRWIDDDHLIVYIVDVSGHGIEASLVSISVHTMLRSNSLKGTSLLDPVAVLSDLNALFTMEKHGENYLTAWYGVYQRSTRTLCYASAGHPPALLFIPGGEAPTVKPLATKGFPVGMFEDGGFRCGEYWVQPGSQLLLYSDGAYELPLPEDDTWSLRDFSCLCARLACSPDWSLDTLIEQLKARTINGHLEDDCSLVKLTFG